MVALHRSATTPSGKMRFYRQAEALADMYENQGYAIIEYNDRENAERAIAEADGTTFLEQTIHVCVFCRAGFVYDLCRLTRISKHFCIRQGSSRRCSTERRQGTRVVTRQEITAGLLCR